MIDEIIEWGIDENKQFSYDAITIIENLCVRFHLVVRQLKARYNNRETLVVEDEYDERGTFSQGKFVRKDLRLPGHAVLFKNSSKAKRAP